MKAKIESLIAELAVTKDEWAQYKSVRGQLRTNELEQENERLRKRVRTYEDVISRNNLWSCFSKSKEKTANRIEQRYYIVRMKCGQNIGSEPDILTVFLMQKCP